MGRSFTRPLKLLSLLAGTVLAAGVRGTNPSFGSSSHLRDCNELLDMTLSAPEVPREKGRCHSLGFLYRGGECAATSRDCVDLKEPMNQEDQTYVVVSHVALPSTPYFEGFVQVGNHFKFSAPNVSNERMPDFYNLTVYGSEDLCFHNMMQTMIIHAPCDERSLPITEGPIQATFSALSPPSRRWKVDIASLTSKDFWTLEWMKASDGAPAHSGEGLSLQGRGASLSIPLEVDMEQEALGIQVTAELVSSSGQHCIIEQVWNGGISES